ncbi:Peroxiredoxin [Chitinophaga eiseniae]|uniref:Peroxiredoxin n=2 Tax=Chitinophaga eiseniae TaxID=634771 RepID=A0A1T4SQI1_9BACT|nr:Peroxiredoxin [Chitinophaga eiseniae]
MIWATACMLPVLSSAQTTYHIKGQLPTGYQAVKAVMSYPPDDKGGEYKSDTALIKNGQFGFSGEIGRPQLAELNLIMPRSKAKPDRQKLSDESGNMKNVGLFYLDGDVHVTFDREGMASYTGGGNEQKAWEYYGGEVGKRSKAGDKNKDGLALIADATREVIRNYPDSYVGVDLLDIFTQAAINPGLVGPMYLGLSKRMQQSEKVLKWKPKLDKARDLVSGNVVAPDFTINDTEGKPVSLSAYRGNYVLVDFWASWCVPCRRENPNVLAAYEKYKNKGFKVLGVSLDTDRKLWLKAIKEDKLPWKQVCDFKADQGKAAKAYEISSIPSNVLIDPNGKIVGKDLRGGVLHDRLAELIK